VDAARTLFLERGYGATTIDAISAVADVPEPTVYRLFSSKLGILRSLLEVSIAGDAADVALAERPVVRDVFEYPTVVGRVAGFAAIVSDINARVGTLYRVLVSAAGSDPAAADLLADLTEQRRKGQRALVRSVAGSLRPGLTTRIAADIVHAVASPEVYQLLVTERGWTSSRYTEWLADTLAAQLLPEGATRS
jgi:AcrR family transcriptional regulator